jgi:putative DNA primase/helicase
MDGIIMANSTSIENCIPEELQKRRQWIVWRRDKDGTKIPMQTTGFPAKVNDPETWCSFDEVVTVSSGFTGIGYVITADDPYTGINLDNCIDEDGNLREWSEPIVSQMAGIGYGEVSPIGTGIKCCSTTWTFSWVVPRWTRH